MPPKKRPWFRVYTEVTADPKIRRLTPSQRWLWISVLAAARQSPVQGALMITDAEAMSVQDIASFADLSLKVTREGLRRLEDLGLVGRDPGAWRARSGRDPGDEVWTVNRWSDRQFETDDVSVRMAEWRSRQSDATSQRRDNDVTKNAPESETESDPLKPPTTSPVTVANGAASGGEEDDRQRFIEATLTATFELMADQTLDRVRAEGQAVHNPTAWKRATVANLTDEHRVAALHHIGDRTTGTYYDLHVEVAEALDPRCGPADGGAARAAAKRAATAAYLHPDHAA